MEKRSEQRVRKRLSVRFGQDTLDRAGFTRDLSASGVFVVCGALPPIGARLQLEILMGAEGWVRRTGVVRRVRYVPPALRHVEQAGFGLSFTDAAPGAPRANPAPPLAPQGPEAPRPAQTKA